MGRNTKNRGVSVWVKIRGVEKTEVVFLVPSIQCIVSLHPLNHPQKLFP